MTAGPTRNAACLRMGAQANVREAIAGRRVIAREGGRSSIAEEPMINRDAAAYWIPAFAGMTAGPTTNAACLRMGAQANVRGINSRWVEDEMAARSLAARP